MKNKHDWICTVAFLLIGFVGLAYAAIVALVS